MIAALLACLALPLSAETAEYGEVYLNGFARDQWRYNDFPEQDAMVCNVNGPDGFLTIRTGPGASYPKARALNRLAIVTLDISIRQGNWVRVVDAHRSVSKDGFGQEYKALPVQGWAHDGFLCDFIH